MCQRKHIFGAKMAIFGPNILIILGGSKSSGTYISENHLGTSFALFFLVGHSIEWIRKANIWPKMTKNACFGNADFGPKIHFFQESTQNPLIDYYLFGERALFSLLSFAWTWLKHGFEP